MQEKADIYVLSSDIDGVLNNRALKKRAAEELHTIEQCRTLRSDSFFLKQQRMLNPADSEHNMAQLMVALHEHLVMQLQNEKNKTSAELFLLLNGSNRQSVDIDKRNAGFLGISAFHVLPHFANVLGAAFDAALLPDGIHNVAAGETWSRRTNPSAEQLNCPYEEHKILLLYFQMHHLATTYPGKKTVFNFVDDRKDILNALSVYFERNRLLIPDTISLNLSFYNEEEDSVYLHQRIDGLGVADTHFHKTLNAFVRGAEKQPSAEGKNAISVDNITAEHLFAALANEELPATRSSSESKKQEKPPIETEEPTPFLFFPPVPKKTRANSNPFQEISLRC